MVVRQTKPFFISAVLLAAGKSKRMGRPKLLLPFGGSTILERTVDNISSSLVDEVIVVLGAGARDLEKVIASRPVKLVFNPDYRRGMSTSLTCGLKMVNRRAQKVMVALADQPLVDKETYNRLIEESLSSEKGIVIPVFQSRRGNPIIFSIGYRQELLGLTGDVGGREIVSRHPDDVLEVALESEGVVVNINTMDEYYCRRESVSQQGGQQNAQKGQTGRSHRHGPGP